MTLGELLKQFNVTRYHHALERNFLRDSLIRAVFSTSLTLNILVWILFFMSEGPDAALPVVLHYSVFQGVDILGPMATFYLLLGGGTFIVLINFLLAHILYRPLRIASYILGGATVGSQLIIILTFITFRLVNY